ncbi:MAG: nitroreductase family protein [Ignavibacteriaceae bacterium]
MDALEGIRTRRSIRKYQTGKVSEDLITELLSCAMFAPSAFDKQPWQFLVLNKKEIFDDILKAAPHAEMIKDASHAIIICGDKEFQENAGLLIQDISAATENLLLTAHSLGLGAVWVGIYPFDEIVEGIKKLFNMPENIVPVSMAVIGYPAEKPEQPERYKQDRIHLNKW